MFTVGFIVDFDGYGRFVLAGMGAVNALRLPWWLGWLGLFAEAEATPTGREWWRVTPNPAQVERDRVERDTSGWWMDEFRTEVEDGS